MGYSGAGKSTLAKALGQRYNCPVLHLDTVQFQENWQERPRQAANARVEAFLDREETWVIDGNYLWDFSIRRRCREADRIVQLLLPRGLCLWRAIRRYLKNRGKVRDSMAPGCREKMDWEFVRWILWDGRRTRFRAAYRAIAEEYGEKVQVCRSRRAVKALVQGR